MRKHHIINAFFAAAMFLLPLNGQAHPGGPMYEDMDDDNRYGHMGGPGFMHGPGRHMRGPYPRMMGPMMGHMTGGDMMGPMAGIFMGDLALDLSDEQRKSIRDIQRAMRKRHLKLMEDMMDATDRLADTYDKHPTDLDKIGSAYDAVHKIKRNMILQHVEARNKVMELLNDEQKKKFKGSSPGYGGHMMMH